MNVACLALILSSAIAGLANPPSPEVPRVLLDAPVAARIAANDVARWQALGVSGFLLHGVYDALDASPQGGLQDLDPTAPESALLKEIRLSIADLAEAGIDQNFLRVSLGPDRAWFADRESARAGIESLGAMGMFCARAGLRGLALDLRTASPMYRFDWPGHGAPRSSTQLSELAREFGRRGLRAFVGAMPDADFIFIVDDLDSAGPLFFSLLEGLVEGVGAATSIRLDMMLSLPREADDFRGRLRYLEEIEERLCDSMGEEARRIWQRQGGYMPVLEPLGLDGDSVVPRAKVSEHRAEVAAAKLIASDYVGIRGGYGTWWTLSSKQAAGYGKLRQRGATAAVATPKALAQAKDWHLRSPFDAMQRVGALRERKDAPYVFLDAQRSAVLFWKAPVGPIVVEEGISGVLSHALGSGVERTLTVGPPGVVLDAADAPVLVRGLPINDWAAPAALWCAFDAAPAAGPGRIPVRLGLRNVYPGNLGGVLKIETPPSLSLGTDQLPVFLTPGDNVVFEKALQGKFSLAEVESLRMSLVSPLSPLTAGVSRQFSTRAHLRSVWRARRDGAVSIPPLVVNDAAGPVIVAASEAGDVAGYSADGTLIWQRRYPAPVVMGAWPGRGVGEEPLVALGDAAGGIRVLASRGGAVWEAQVPGRVAEACFADVYALGRDALLVRTSGDMLLCFSADGRLEWTYAAGGSLQIGTPAQARRFTHDARLEEERLFISVGGESPQLVRLGAQGAALWSRPLAAEAALAPVVLPGRDSVPARVVVPVGEGELAMFSLDIGAPIEHAAPALKGKWSCFQPLAPNMASQGVALLAGCGNEFVGLDGALAPLWRAETGRVRAVGWVGGHWLVLGAGQVAALDAGGVVRWKDTPPIAARTLATLGPPHSGGERPVFVVGGGSGFLHVLAFPPAE